MEKINQQTKEELDALLGSLRDGDLSDEEIQRLDVLLTDNPAAQSYYAEYLDLCSMLRRYHGANANAEIRSWQQPPASQNMKIHSGLWRMAIAAILFIGVMITFVMLPQENTSMMTDQGASGAVVGVAVLTRSVDATWGDGQSPVEEGAALPAGSLVINSGLVQIEFYSGAKVILQGPAHFEMKSENEGYFYYGKMRTHVPPQATGFKIGSPNINVIDLGTEFGMSVTQQGVAEVHVIDGEVELHEILGKTTASPPQLIVGGQGVRVESDGSTQAIGANTNAFVGPKELTDRSQAIQRRRYTRWLSHLETLGQDSSLVVHYTFESEAESQSGWGRELANQVPNTTDATHGAIIGCNWTVGRWPGKPALEFKQASDRVRIDVPGQFDSLTFSTWVRFDGFDRQYISLMLTDGYDDSEPHWQVHWDGRIFLGIGGMGNHTSRPILEPKHLGQWVHIATVYDQDSSSVSHYLNGKLVDAIPFNSEHRPLAIGDAQIGNWNPLGKASADRPGSVMLRNLNGVMDEFALYQRALNATEIRNLYNLGRALAMQGE